MLPILFQDQRFVVFDKPAGLPVHAGPSGGPSVEDFFPALSRRRTGPWLVHRLDADTSGCLVVALRKTALLDAQAEFAAGRARKTYWAIVQGHPPAEHGIIDAPLAKRGTSQAWHMEPDPSGRAAITAYRVRARAAGTSWLELRPATGRTHQIRVHCAAIGCPLLGDPIYGDGRGPLMLLARALTLELQPVVRAIAHPPSAMRAMLAGFGGGGLIAGSEDVQEMRT